MINSDIVIIGEKPFRKTYSDTYYIKKVGTEQIYSEAYDILENNFEYEETDRPLEAYPIV